MSHRSNARHPSDPSTVPATREVFDNEEALQRDQADKWSRIAFGLFGVACATAIAFTVWSVLANDFELSLVAMKVAAVDLLLLPAVYAAQQSRHHRTRAIETRQFYLRLAAYDTIAEALGGERGREARAYFAERLFSDPWRQRLYASTKPRGSGQRSA